MRAARAVLAVVVASVLAGCTIALPAVVAPEEPGQPWTQTEATLWVVRQTTCGECAHNTEAADFDLTLLYRDGSVLRARFGEGGQAQIEGRPQQEGDRRGLTFAEPGLATDFRDEVLAAWRAMNDEEPDVVRVYEVQAMRIGADEREGVLRVVDHALDQTADLRQSFPQECQPEAFCFDGIEVRYGAWGKPQEAKAPRGMASVLGPDDGWRLLEDQMLALHDWLAS